MVYPRREAGEAYGEERYTELGMALEREYIQERRGKRKSGTTSIVVRRPVFE